MTDAEGDATPQRGDARNQTRRTREITEARMVIVAGTLTPGPDLHHAGGGAILPIGRRAALKGRETTAENETAILATADEIITTSGPDTALTMGGVQMARSDRIEVRMSERAN